MSAETSMAKGGAHANEDGAQHGQHSAEASHGSERNVSAAARLLASKIRPKHCISIVVYLLLALIVFAPITAHMSSLAPGTGGDTYQNLWGLWWVPYATFKLHTSIWFTNLLFWPVGTNLAYQTMAPIGAILTSPFQAISVPFAYNVLFFTGFVLSGIAMFILADYITGNQYASFFAGLVFAFSSFHVAQALGHIDWMNIEWVPLALYFFIRMVKDKNKYIYGIGLAASFVLATFMGDIEQGVMLVLLLAVVFVMYAVYKNTRRLLLDRRFWYAAAIFIVLAFVIGSFGFIPIIRTITSPGGLSNANYLNTIQENELWSDPILSFFLPSYFNGIFHDASLGYYNIFAGDPPERVAYIGYSVILLMAIGIYKNFKETRLWLVIGLLFGWMTLGPYVQLGAFNPSSTGGIPGLYYLYHSIPGLNVVREPDRFYLVFSVATAILAAIGFKSLLELVKERTAAGQGRNYRYMCIGLLSVFSIIFLIESTGFMTSQLAQVATTPIYVPRFYYLISNLTQNFSVMQLPSLQSSNVSFPALAIGQATYYTSVSHKPIVGGYVGRENLTQELSLSYLPLAAASTNLEGGNFSYASPVVENYANETLLTLYNYKTAFITINKQAYNTSELDQLALYMIGIFGNPVYVGNTTVAFSTSNAINSSIFRSYVSYPLANEWYPISGFVNGKIADMWEPLGTGEITTFAPYQNTTNIYSKIYSGSASRINTTISFGAMSLGGPATLYIETPTSPTTVQYLAEINLTSSTRMYSLNVSMVSGPQGNTMFFISNGKSGVGISNITISERQ